MRMRSFDPYFHKHNNTHQPNTLPTTLIIHSANTSELSIHAPITFYDLSF